MNTTITKILCFPIGLIMFLGSLISGEGFAWRILSLVKQRSLSKKKIRMIRKNHKDRFFQFEGIDCVIDTDLSHLGGVGFIALSGEFNNKALIFVSRHPNLNDTHDVTAMWYAIAHCRLNHQRQLEKHYIATGQSGIVTVDQYHEADAYVAQRLGIDIVNDYLQYLMKVIPDPKVKAVTQRRVHKLYWS